MMISLSKLIDVADYKWVRYTAVRATNYNDHNRYNDLSLETKDIFGYSRTRKNTYRIVDAKEQSIFFTLSEHEFSLLMKKSRPYKGSIKQQLEQRAVVTRTRKNAQERYKAPFSITGEKRVINRANYQWLVYTNNQTHAIISKTGALAETLSKGTIYGLRITSPKKGGVIVFEDGQRARITTDRYDKLVGYSKVMPTQPKGTIIPATSTRLPVEIEQVSLRRAFITGAPVIKRRQDVNVVTRRSDTVKGKHDVKTKLQTGIKQKLTKTRVVQDINKHLEKQFGTDIDDADKAALKKTKPLPKHKNKVTVKPKPKAKPEEPINNDDIFHIGNVIVFNKDDQNRKYLIVDKYPLENNERMTKYVVYDTTNSPKYLQILRLRSDLKEHALDKYAKSVKQADRKLMTRIKELIKLPESKESVYG